MSGDKYFITDQHATYFITCTIIHWIDLFTKKEYRNIIVESLNYCIDHKSLQLYSWVIMSNHLHLFARCSAPGTMSGFLRVLKKLPLKDL